MDAVSTFSETGVKVIEIEVVCPQLSVPVNPAHAKPATLIGAKLTFSGMEPLLVMTNVLVEVVPTGTLPKLKLVALNVIPNEAATALPLHARLCVPSPAVTTR